MIVARDFPVRRIFRQLRLPLLLMLAYDVGVTALYVAGGQRWLAVELPLGLLGSALAIVVGLRNNSAYARWWEARTLWGSVTNNARSLARGALAMLPDGGDVRHLLRLQLAWVEALRLGLWRQDTAPALAGLPAAVRDRVAGGGNLPAALQGEMARFLGGLARAGRLDPVRLSSLDATLGRLADAQGGLERIRNTPLPRQFDQFGRVFVSAYCLSLPVGLVGDLGIATPIGSTVIGIAFYALDQIGRDLQDPFGGTVHDVPMAAIGRTIEADLLGAMGEHELPAAATPVEGVLA